ncbi:MAG: hypothetical protein ACJ749_14105 [Flavisolibacter sp.]
MKTVFYFSLLSCLFACKEKKALVDPVFVDSLLTSFEKSAFANTNDQDITFWKHRAEKPDAGFVNQQKYAQGLVSRFRIYGDIRDLVIADSIMRVIASQYKEPGYLLTLAGYSMLQHRFAEAGSYIDTVIQMNAERFATQMMKFDADIEVGKYIEAAAILKTNAAPDNYAYNFRLSKQDHYQGKTDSAINHMLKAATLAQSNPYLKQAALSNLADLYLHQGKLEMAEEIYRQSIASNSCDFHSIMGLGWIALAHDKNDSLAIKLFQFVQNKLWSPEPLLKLSQANELHDFVLAKKYAVEFVRQASEPVYGTMYNKYLVQLYTGILNESSKAVDLAKKEVKLRGTPQTYAWLAWSLFSNHRVKEAYEVYQKYVSGKPLEAYELYCMGMLMKGVHKVYDAQQFFNAAQKNRYDLSPAMMKELEGALSM